jgi:hypothetical protein
MSNDILFKVIKVKYSPSYDYSKRWDDPERLKGYYISKAETVYRTRKGDVHSAINHAKRANKRADRERAARPGTYPEYYRVEVTTVYVKELGPYDKVVPDVAR